MNPRLLLLACLSLSLPDGSASARSAPLIRPGDRVALVGNTFADMMRKHGYFEAIVSQRSGDVSMRNLGWAGDTVFIRQRPTGFPAEDQTLASHGADVILVCFGMGESFDGKDGLDSFRDALEVLARHYQRQKYNGKTAPRLALVSPIAYEDLGGITPSVNERNLDLAAYTGAVKDVAEEIGAHFVDLYAPTRTLMEAKNSPDLTTNGIRLSGYGYWAVGNILADALLPGEGRWRLDIDATRKVGEAKGVRLREVEATGGAIQFRVEELGWALPGPPTGEVHGDLPIERDTLSVKNLAPAYYTLAVDGEPIATATHEEWAAGVAIDHSPAHRDADAFRRLVNDKNDQFFFSWRALNQVHIVGERRKSPSGRELPREVIEFDDLAKERERELRLIDPPAKSRIWKLIANPERKLP